MVFVSLFVDHSLSSLRIYAAVMHFIATFFLTWTRVDSINSSFGRWGDSFSDTQYSHQRIQLRRLYFDGHNLLICEFLYILVHRIPRQELQQRHVFIPRCLRHVLLFVDSDRWVGVDHLRLCVDFLCVFPLPLQRDEARNLSSK